MKLLRLYLGSRFAEWGVGSEVIGACAQYADVVSFNCYKANINQSWINTGTSDKPIIIGEFHFNAKDRGQFAPGLCPVASQTARGTRITSYNVCYTKLLRSYTGTIGDNADLLYQIADKYYKTVHDALAAKLPNKLYLGFV